jgi:hypothetical protein
LAKVKTTIPDLTETVVLSTLVKFDADGIAEVEDEEVLAVLKEVGEANGTFSVLETEEEDPAALEEDDKKDQQKKKKAPKSK